MHRGVRGFIDWLEKNRDTEAVELSPPATTSDLGALEQQLGVPLPADLRLVLGRFNGGSIPAGTLLPAATGPGTIEAAVREFAEAVGADFLDPELLLPFHRTSEGSLLCFDRAAGPVSDTWPIVDYYEDTGDTRLVHRTFDGWCQKCVADWRSDDFLQTFTLDTYLRQGQRHVAVEPDVASAHATVAHAFKRAGRAGEALDSYLQAARCVPPLPWCDWEALKIAALLGEVTDALEAAGRLCSRCPKGGWIKRETSPGRVAEVIAEVALTQTDRAPWLRLLEMLRSQAREDEAVVGALHDALAEGVELPLPRPWRESPLIPPTDDLDALWSAAYQAYHAGQLRDEDLLLEPSLRQFRRRYPMGQLLAICRDF